VPQLIRGFASALGGQEVDRDAVALGPRAAATDQIERVGRGTRLHAVRQAVLPLRRAARHLPHCVPLLHAVRDRAPVPAHTRFSFPSFDPIRCCRHPADRSAIAQPSPCRYTTGPPVVSVHAPGPPGQVYRDGSGPATALSRLTMRLPVGKRAPLAPTRRPAAPPGSVGAYYPTAHDLCPVSTARTGLRRPRRPHAARRLSPSSRLRSSAAARPQLWQ